MCVCIRMFISHTLSHIQGEPTQLLHNSEYYNSVVINQIFDVLES